jgi:guanylate kinase
VGEEKFRAKIAAGDLVEWAQVHGNLYGTSRSFLEEQCGQGKVVVLDIDVQGVESLKKVFGDRCLSIFVLPPSMEELETRLRARNTESEEKLRERLRNSAAEMTHAPKFDHRIVNRELQESFRELCSIVEREVGLV